MSRARSRRWPKGGAIGAAPLSVCALALVGACSRDLEVGRFLGPGTSESTTGAGGASSSSGASTAGSGGTAQGVGGSGGGTTGAGGASTMSASASSASSSSGTGGSGGGAGGGILGLGCLPTSPGGPEAVAEGADSVLLAAAGSAIYWVDQGKNGAPSAVYRFPVSPLCDGTFTSTPLGVRRVGGLGRDLTNLYVTLGDPGELWQIPHAGGNTVVLASGPSAFGALTTDGVDVYWAIPDDGKVMKVAVGGGVPVEVATGEGAPAGLTIEIADLYWTTDSPAAIRSRPKSLALPASTVVVEPSRPLSFSVSSNVLYWVRPTSAPNAHDGAVMFTPTGGGQVSPLVSGLASPTSLSTDGKYVYWTDTIDQVVMYVPHGMPGAPAPFAVAQDGPDGLTGAGPLLYWVNGGLKQLVRLPRKQ